MLRAVLPCLLLCGGLVAQDYLYLTGFSDSGGPLGPNGNSYPLSRFRDLNGDGLINDTTELFAFVKTSFNTRNGSGSFVTDIAWVQEGDNYAFYISDSGDGRITRGVDANNNGVLDNNEVTEFYDMMTGFAPEGIAVRFDTTLQKSVVYVANDDQSSAPGIHRLVDLDGNGDAKGAGEHSIIVDASKGLGVGGVTLQNDWWFAVEVLDNGKIIAYNAGPSNMTGGGGGAQGPDMFCWYEFIDNGGVATSFGVFFNPSQINGLPTHPDFAIGGAFPQWDIKLDTVANPNLHPTWSDIPFFTQARRKTPGPTSYYMTSSYRDSMTGGFSGNNPAGQLIAGLTYRWTDLNGNFSIDPNEITLFANITNSTVAGVMPFTYQSSGTTIVVLNSNIFGLKATADGKLHLCWDLTGPGAKGVIEMEDMNGNGVIETGECRQSYFWSGSQSATAPVYHAGFGPFIKSFSAFDMGLMPGPFQAGIDSYSSGCPQPTSGLTAVCDTGGGMPQVGNMSFAVDVLRALPNLPGNFLFIGFTRANIPLTGLGLPSNCILLTNPIIGIGPFASNDCGISTAPMQIPNTPALITKKVFFQWIVGDPGAAVPFRTSNGLEITIQP